jgi:antitoxin Phd
MEGKGEKMLINSQNIVPISRASRNFSEVAHLAERAGEVFLFKNNRPKFRLIDVEAHPEIEMTDAEKIEFVARRILRRHRAAFLELAK